MGTLYKFFSTPTEEKVLFFKAVFWLIAAKIFFKYIVLRKNKNEKYEQSLTPEQIQTIKTITIAVKRASYRMPWKNKCLVEAITAKYMLKTYHIPTTLYLGLKKSNGAKTGLIAHAWLKHGDFVIIGGCGNSFVKVYPKN